MSAFAVYAANPLPTRSRRSRNRRGSSLVEFAISLFLLIVVMLSVVEMARMVLVYIGVSNAARSAIRYAIVHGANRLGSGPSGPSGPSADPPEVLRVARNFAGLASGPTLQISVLYPSGANAIGSPVSVTVAHLYTPMVLWLPLNVTLRSTSRGVIVF